MRIRKEDLIKLFVFVIYFIAIPTSTIFAFVSATIMSIFSFKGTLFVLTGSPSTIANVTNVAEGFVRIAPSEAAMGAFLVLTGTIVAVVAKSLKHRNNNEAAAVEKVQEQQLEQLVVEEPTL
jgi:hypothetical protein